MVQYTMLRYAMVLYATVAIAIENKYSYLLDWHKTFANKTVDCIIQPSNTVGILLWYPNESEPKQKNILDVKRGKWRIDVWNAV